MVSVRVGNSAVLECLSNAIPPPTITWYKNGRLVTESSNLRVLADGQTLEIKETEVCGCVSLMSGGEKHNRIGMGLLFKLGCPLFASGVRYRLVRLQGQQRSRPGGQELPPEHLRLDKIIFLPLYKARCCLYSY